MRVRPYGQDGQDGQDGKVCINLLFNQNISVKAVAALEEIARIQRRREDDARRQRERYARQKAKKNGGTSGGIWGGGQGAGTARGCQPWAPFVKGRTPRARGPPMCRAGALPLVG